MVSICAICLQNPENAKQSYSILYVNTLWIQMLIFFFRTEKLIIVWLCVISNRMSVYVTGRRIAELELHIALAHMMKNFKVEYPENTPMDYIENFFQILPERKINLVFKDVSK